MAGTVFFSVSMSLDGFIAPEAVEDLMGRQWMELQRWVFPQRFFRENLKLGAGGEEGRDNDILRETFERTGASVMGKRQHERSTTEQSRWRGSIARGRKARDVFVVDRWWEDLSCSGERTVRMVIATQGIAR